MTRYGDYCPIVTGVEVLGDRWTPLVIRELMVGASGFNEIHRGLPRISRSLLAQRLRMLERRGLVRHEAEVRGRAGRYLLTPSGESIAQVVWAMGRWAAEWVFGDPTEEDLDGLSVIWRLHQKAVPQALPAERIVVHLSLTGPGGAEGWLEIDSREVTVCREDPGVDVDLALEGDTAAMHRWIVGKTPFRELVTSGSVRLLGPSRLSRGFPTWFDTSMFVEGFRAAAQHRREPQTA